MNYQSYLTNLNSVLRSVATELDLNPERYQKAVSEYTKISEWLNASASDLAKYQPQIYPQGSLNLGTIVKPLNSDDDYDVDLVCELAGIPSSQSPKVLKQIVGMRLRENEKFKQMLIEKNRCWQLVFPGDFHLDVLPAIPDEIKNGNAILVPDNKLANWTPSNPKDYSSWFSGRMLEQFTKQRELLAGALYKEIEEIPTYTVKTTLQQAVQLLKRNRDIYFIDREDEKPISVILTTLSALAYTNNPDLFRSLEAIVREMPGLVQIMNGEHWIANPINPEENFADKWAENSELADAFFEWINNISAQLLALKDSSSLHEVKEQLMVMFGKHVITESFKEIDAQVSHTPHIVGVSNVNIYHREPLKWDFEPRFNVSISAIRKASKVLKGVMPRNFPSNGPPMPKQYSLEFTAGTNALHPFTIEWQVTNTGEEARQANDLRGGFVSSSGSKDGSFYRIERTVYKGTHLIEAFVIIDGKCVGRSGEFIVNIE